MHVTRAFILLAIAVLLVACGPSPRIGSTATVVAAPSPTPTAVKTPCPWVENPGPPPPEVEKRAQQAFASTGLTGTLVVRGAGEWACTEFHLRNVDFEFTLLVSDLKDQNALKAIAAQVQDIPKQALQNQSRLGSLRIRFKADKQFCWWNVEKGCGDIMIER
jgi:hypothetical protein